MAALSDYLESQLLNHIFRGSNFPKPSSIAIALTSGVPLDNGTGSGIFELPSGVNSGNNFVTTNYKRLNLFDPATSGENIWNSVGIDNTTAFYVSGVSSSGNVGLSGYFYPLYLNETVAQQADPFLATTPFRFFEFPGVLFYSPNSLKQSGVAQKPSYPQYEGNGFIKNATQLVFDTALTDWGWISGVAILDSADYGSGNLLMYSKLTNPRYVYTGDNIKFDLNSLEISLQ